PMHSMKRTALAIALSCAALYAGAALAADAPRYPAKVVRTVVGFAPRGALGVQARVVVQRLAELLGQSVIVENRAGADGIVAGEFVAKSPPGGYTLTYTRRGHAMNSVLHAKTLPYHPVKDFAPISLAASG